MKGDSKKQNTTVDETKLHETTRNAWFEYYRIRRSIEFLEQYNSENTWFKLQSKIKKRKIRRITYYGGIAASFLLLLGITHSFLNTRHFYSSHDLSAITYSFPEKGGRKAILELDNGQQIDLAKESGSIKYQEVPIAINKIKDLLSYTDVRIYKKDIISYHTLTVPRGGEYQLILSDSTKVWMNAASNLHYPVPFMPDAREVFLSGEAFFEVKKDSQRPFIINIGTTKIKVLGTKFNVSSYPENNSYITLSEGKIEVSTNGYKTILSPNQQLIITPDNNIEKKEVEARLFSSWTNEIYEFKDTSLEDIAAQLSRWFDIDILIKDEKIKQKRFTGAIFRNNELNFAIDAIERISNVKFIRESNNIHIINK